MTHTLKCWPAEFESIASGDKTAEVRRNDRGFNVNDTLYLREWDPRTGRYSEREMLASVKHVVLGGEWGLPPGLCVMSIEVFTANFIRD